MSILFKDVGWIVTQNPKREIIENSSVYVEDGKIVEIGNPNVEAEFVIDGKGKVLLPGLINSHTHSSMSLLRGYSDDMPLQPWLEDKIWPLESKLKAKDCYVGSLLACLEMISFGTTCFNDMYIFVDEIANAVKKAGIRCFLGEVIFDWNIDEKMGYFENFVKKWNADDLITPVVNPHAPYSCNEETMKRLDEFSKRHNLLKHVHVSETEKEVKDFEKNKKKTPVKWLDDIGILDDKFIAVHCNWLREKDVEIFSKRNVSMVHCATSCMKFGNGRVPPLKDIFKKGIRMGLGTDSCASNNNLDMFEEMENCSLVNKFQERDPTHLPAQKTLDLVTVDAAKIFGVEDEIGSIEEGKTADLILVDFKQPHLKPIHGKDTVISNLIYSCSGQDVETTVVNGKILMENKEFKTLEKEKTFQMVEKAMQRLLSA